MNKLNLTLIITFVFAFYFVMKDNPLLKGFLFNQTTTVSKSDIFFSSVNVKQEKQSFDVYADLTLANVSNIPVKNIFFECTYNNNYGEQMQEKHNKTIKETVKARSALKLDNFFMGNLLASFAQAECKIKEFDTE